MFQRLVRPLTCSFALQWHCWHPLLRSGRGSESLSLPEAGQSKAYVHACIARSVFLLHAAWPKASTRFFDCACHRRRLSALHMCKGTWALGPD